MARRADPSTLAKITAIRAVQRAQAELAVARATAEERQARSAAADVEAAREAAEAEWHRHLAGVAFAPEFAQALAGQLVEHSTNARTAGDRVSQAAAVREERQAAWRASDARLQQAEEALDECRRLTLRSRDARALDALSDRVTFAWSLL